MNKSKTNNASKIRPMTNFDFDRLLDRYKEYGGCFSKDLVNSKNCKNGKLHILNMAPLSSEGTHWVLLSLVDKDINFYYDSFSGYPPMSVERFLKQQRKDALLSPLYESDQNISSITCGYYCLLMSLLILEKGYTPQQCIDFFQTDTKYNEEIINEFALDVLERLNEN